jgi:hypothetical protein
MLLSMVQKAIAISEVKYGCMWRCLPTAYPAKAVPPFGSSNNGLHSCRILIAEKHGANNWQEQSKAPLTVQYEIHTSVQPIQKPNWRSTSKKLSMGACEGAFPLPILWKQHCPSALQTMDYTPADYRLQKNVGQTTDRNRARLHWLFGMKFTQVPSQYSNHGIICMNILVMKSCNFKCDLEPWYHGWLACMIK